MPGRFDNSTISRVQQANDIVDVVSEHLKLARKGKEMVGMCPFHDDHRPSMNVSIAKQIFKCFACGAGGDVFKFVQLRENLSFSQAVERLAQRAGIKIEPIRRQRGNTETNSGQQLDPRKLAKVNLWAAKLWQGNLADEQKGRFAREYIRDRQISDNSVKKWGLGLAIDNWQQLVEAGIDAKIPFGLLGQAGLSVKRDNGQGWYDKFRDRLMFPITDVTGRVIGFGGRTLGTDGAKYMNSPATALFDKSNCLYGLEQARHEIVSSGTVVVVEGYTDCIMAHQFGCCNVVATLGTSFTSGHARLLRRYAKRAVLIFDNDVAGIAAADRALEICLAGRIDIKIASVPEGKDPCDFLLSAGREKFEELTANAVDVMEFKWNRLAEQFNSSETFTDRRTAMEGFLTTMATAMSAGRVDAIGRGLIVNRLSRIIGLDSKEINEELRKASRRIVRAAGYASREQRVINADVGDGFYAAAQQEILEVLLNEPKMFEEIRQRITVDDFNVPIFRQIASVLFEVLARQGEISLAGILRNVESVEVAGVLTELAEVGEKKGNFHVRLQDAFDTMDEYAKQHRQRNIKPGADEGESLKQLQLGLEKGNLRSVGME